MEMDTTHQIQLAQDLLGLCIAELRDYGLSDFCIAAALSNRTGEFWQQLIPNADTRRRVATQAAVISISK
jgi:hypothetical protein